MGIFDRFIMQTFLFIDRLYFLNDFLMNQIMPMPINYDVFQVSAKRLVLCTVYEEILVLFIHLVGFSIC